MPYAGRFIPVSTTHCRNSEKYRLTCTIALTHETRYVKTFQ